MPSLIPQLFLYSAAVVLLWLQADRADALSAGTDDVDTEPVKPVTGDFVVEKVGQHHQQG